MTQALSQPHSKPVTESGWHAYLRLGFHQGVRRTELAERSRFGPLSVQRPFYPEDGVCHVYVLHPPGGIVGGDRLDIDVTANNGANALITTPGAGKFYRSAGDVALLTQTLRVGRNATLEWLPQENIYFPGARTRVQTRIELDARSRLAWWEIQCFGRPVIDESFDAGAIDSRLEILLDDRPLLIERPRVDPATRRRGSMMASLPVSATLVLFPCTVEHLETARLALENSSIDDTDSGRVGVTLLDGLLIARYLGGDTAQARRQLAAIWQALRPEVVGHNPVTPRIWLT